MISRSFIIKTRAQISKAAPLRCLSTSAAESSHNFYARIGASTYQPKDTQSKLHNPRSNDRIKSKLSPTYFSGRPMYYDSLYELDTLVKSHASLLDGKELAQIGSHDGAGLWVSKDHLEDEWRFKITTDEYHGIVSRLNMLNSIRDQTTNQKLSAILKRFTASGHHNDAQINSRELDSWGRAFAMGYRRRVRAFVWMTEAKEMGEGKVFINGVDFVDYFERLSYRNEIIKPFELTNTVGKYNVWCQIEAGVPNALGNIAVSGATTNGIANALLTFQPECEAVLREGWKFSGTPTDFAS